MGLILCFTEGDLFCLLFSLIFVKLTGKESMILF